MLKLREVELFGFKSFADRTRIPLPDDLLVVVGPNGSGKSNVTDAVLWALGEQSARILRGHKMQDVIFGGSHKRPPSGMAEVWLAEVAGPAGFVKRVALKLVRADRGEDPDASAPVAVESDRRRDQEDDNDPPQMCSTTKWLGICFTWIIVVASAGPRPRGR